MQLVSIESMIQRGRAPGEPVAIVMITHEAQQVAVVRALQAISASDKVVEFPCMIPMETPDAVRPSGCARLLKIEIVPRIPPVRSSGAGLHRFCLWSSDRIWGGAFSNVDS